MSGPKSSRYTLTAEQLKRILAEQERLRRELEEKARKERECKEARVYLATTKEKVDWLARYNFPADEIHCVPYGTPKHTVTQHYGGYQILFDDNQKVREEWKLGETVDANQNILPYLMKLINKELN